MTGTKYLHLPTQVESAYYVFDTGAFASRLSIILCFMYNKMPMKHSILGSNI